MCRGVVRAEKSEVRDGCVCYWVLCVEYTLEFSVISHEFVPGLVRSDEGEQSGCSLRVDALKAREFLWCESADSEISVGLGLRDHSWISV